MPAAVQTIGIRPLFESFLAIEPDQQDIVLSPQSCGTVEIDGQPNGAYYLINSGDGTVKREGNLPLEKGLVLPIGGYHFTAQKPQCAQYEQDFSLTAGQTLRIPFRMICASP